MTPARLLLAAGLVAGALGVPATAAPPRAQPVVAILGEPGALNVLHADFRTRDGRDAVLPAGLPRPVRVTLPRQGSFADRMAAVAAGPLGHLRANTLYYVAGTRLLIVSTKDVAGQYTADVVSGDRLHSTGVVSAAIGRRYGTAPDALAVFVAGAGSEPWDWVAAQRWVDVASTSSYGIPHVAAASGSARTTLLCQGAAAVHTMTKTGRLVLSSSGNTSDQAEPLVSPNGLPDVYQVGGVDKTGRAWLPGHTEESDPFFAAGTVMRPYETGELYSFPAAAPDALDGAVHFGGTSGATPRTAGWALQLLAAARRLGRASRGPLVDGRLTLAELGDLLRHSAVPAESPSPGRYFVEGYGALDAAAIVRASAVLAGRADLPARPDEDAASAAARQARAAVFADARCTV